MANPIYGTAFLAIQPDLAGFATTLQRNVTAGGLLAGIGRGAGLAVGAAMVTGVGAAIGGGVLLAQVGETFDEALDTIRVGTGATGDALAALGEDFKEVFASVPTDAATAATAIADLNTRLGLTGSELQTTAAQFIELSRITGTDLSSNIANVTRVFGDWSIATADQAGTLDALFRANQATGISIDQLTANLVKFGAPLRQLGFDFETSAALISKFEKEGVNAELVLGSMRIALGKMARAGEPAQETFQRVVEEINNAGSASEANALALELFGARAGPDMAAAIREGRFAIGDLFDTIANGEDTIRSAADDTNDWRESLNVLKNRVLVALEPLATRVFGAIGDAVEAATPFIERVVEWLSVALPRAFEVIGPIVSTVFNGIRDFFGGLGDAASAGGVQSALSGIVSIFQTMIQNVQTVLSTVLPIIRDVFGGIVKAFQENEGKISGIVTNLAKIFSAIGEVVSTVFGAIREFWAEWGDEVTALVSNAFNTIVGIISAVVEVISGIIDILAGTFTGDWQQVWEGVKSIFSGVWNAIVTLLKGVVGQIMAVFGDFFRELGASVQRGVGNVVRFFRELPGKILDALKGLGAEMVKVGKSLVDGLIQGIVNLPNRLFDGLKNGISKALTNVKNFFGIRSPSRVFRDEIGAELGAGILAGVEDSLDILAGLMREGIASAQKEIAKTVRPIDVEVLGGDDPDILGAVRRATTELSVDVDGLGGGPFIGQMTVNNPIGEPTEDSLQAALIEVAVSPTVNRLVSAGSSR